MKIIRKIYQVLELAVFFIYKSISSSLKVAWDILFTPNHNITPAIVEVPLNTKRDLQTYLVFNLVTMTPGSLSIDLDKSGKKIYIHTMYIHDKESFIRNFRKLERRIIKVLS